MSIWIERMETPPDGRYALCVTHDSNGGVHCVIQNQDTLEFLKHGAVIEIPEPHGDMKDINHINQVLDRFSGYLDDDMIYRLKIAIGRDAPTVIPASEECE